MSLRGSSTAFWFLCPIENCFKCAVTVLVRCCVQVLDILGRHWEARSMRHPPYMQPSPLSGVTKAEQAALAAPMVAAVRAAKVRAYEAGGTVRCHPP